MVTTDTPTGRYAVLRFIGAHHFLTTRGRIVRTADGQILDPCEAEKLCL